MEPFSEADEVTQRAIDAIREGRTNGRPTYEAASSIVEEESQRRREALRIYIDSGSTAPLDPELFPPKVFEADGSRKKAQDGTWMLTEAEARAAYEWEDSRWV